MDIVKPMTAFELRQYSCHDLLETGRRASRCIQYLNVRELFVTFVLARVFAVSFTFDIH